MAELGPRRSLDGRAARRRQPGTMPTPILVAITPGDRDRGAFDAAVAMARITHAPLLLAAVAIPADVMPSSAIAGWMAEAAEPGWLARAAAQQLMELSATVPDDVAVTTATTIAHSVAVGLEELAAKSHASLIVLGASHRTLLSRIVDEDPTLGVVRHASCPVLIAHPDEGATAPLAPPARIAVAWTRAAEAQQALSYAAELARQAGAALEVIHVLEPLAPRLVPSLAPGIEHGQLADRIAAAEEEIRTALAAAGVDAADISVREGQIGPELARASAHDDLLVIGSRQHGPMRRVVSGSASAYLAHHGRCPILVTPRRLSSPAPV